ncbi:tRNA lysidine(34) synthetase TilS [Candidatus Schneideria nysicola]|uniref:tRNA lysidine(34) synthetase TilS n=1 Tax=Candidatus Schneideria nysicola TaxID=1081631 RepID=UPI001CAA553E|nr:tRNA lysidine(34) synthetase TilS [Candidatus Schneideria nysicola]UAJ66167.1 tRNA lysidine(34) synthetase TilS [Candidatus Schneideria nysicola]
MINKENNILINFNSNQYFSHLHKVIMKINILSTQSIQHLLLKKILSIISEYNQFLLAYSGGLDSTVLLDILSKIKIKNFFQLRAVYINHKINPSSDDWSLHCKEQCEYRDIPFKNISINIKQNMTKNIDEAILRSARYNALSSDLQLREVLLTAHHQNDQAETLMLALKRGSGPTGLSAMATNNQLYKHRILRPLLYCKKKDIIKYAKQFKLKWINDDSNMNTRFDRNFLRLNIFPLLENRWPNFITTVSRSAQLCREQEELLDELLAETLTTLTKNGSLYIQPLYTMSVPRRKYILRHWIAKYGNIFPSSKQLEILWKEVILSRCDAKPVISLGSKKIKKEIRRFRNYLYLLSTKNKISQQLISWNNKSCYCFLPDNIGILFHMPINNFESIQPKEKKSIFPLCSDSPLESIVRAPKINENIFIRFGTVQGLLKIFGRKHRCYLKKIWKEFNIPPWERPRIPLLFYNNSFIAAIGIFTINDEEFLDKQSSKWRFYWIRNHYNS